MEAELWVLSSPGAWASSPETQPVRAPAKASSENRVWVRMVGRPLCPEGLTPTIPWNCALRYSALNRSVFVDIKPKETPTPSPESAPTATTVDIGASFSYMTADPQWMNKVVIMGLVTMIPVAGYLVFFGWMREIFERAQEGRKELPALDFGSQLEKGIAPFVAMLGPMVAMMVGMFGLQLIMLPFALLSEALRGTAVEGVAAVLVGLFSMLIMLVMMVAMFVISAVVPETMRRGMRGEMMPIFSPKASFVAIKNNASAYLMVLVGGFAFNMVSQVGVFVCIVGMFLTMPLAAVGLSHLLAQWDRVAGDPQAA